MRKGQSFRLFRRLSPPRLLSFLPGEAELLGESLEDYEYDAGGGCLIYQTNRTELFAETPQITIFVGCKRAGHAQCQPVEQGDRDIAGDGDELHQVSGRCAFSQYALSGGRGVSQEAGEGIYVQLESDVPDTPHAGE